MRILVVDDEFVARTAMIAMLSGFGECDEAKDGIEGMNMFFDAIVKDRPYDLVTIDIDMPDMNGIEFLKLIKAEEEKRGLPKSKKLMITSMSVLTNVLKALQSKCDAFLVKPVRKKALVNKLLDIDALPREYLAESPGNSIDENDSDDQ